MASSTTATNGRTLGGGLAPLGLTPEAAARKTQRRVNTRLLAGLVLVAVAFIGFLVFVVSSAPVTRGIVVATRDLPSGTRLSRGDLAVAQVQVGQAQALAEMVERVRQLEGLPPAVDGPPQPAPASRSTNSRRRRPGQPRPADPSSA